MTTDRFDGALSSLAIKAPCRVATTENITLSGLQTVDGVALAVDDRVLVKNQTNTVNNGIYNADTSGWNRAPDFDGNQDIVKGTMIRVTDGTNNADGWFVITSNNPLTIDTSTISFDRLQLNFVATSSTVATAGQTIFNLGVTYQTGTNNLGVYVNGLRQRLTADYVETSTSRITFTYGLQAGDEVDVYAGLDLGGLTAAQAAAVALVDAGDFYAGATVEAVLQEIRDAITIDNGDTDQTLTYNSSTAIQRWNTALTTNRTATLSLTGAKEGAHFVIVRGPGATGASTLAAGSLATLRTPGQWCEVRYDAGSTAWVLEKMGYLPSADFPAVSADKGDADATLTVGTSEHTAIWQSSITAERAATLSATGAWNGARFEVIRTEGAGGAFSLTVVVGSTRLVRLAPAHRASFEFNGTTWILTGFGPIRPGVMSVVELKDDFVGSEIDNTKWQGIIGTDAQCQMPSMNASQVSGVVRMTTGDDAAATMAVNGVQLQSDLNWRPNKGGLVCELRVAMDDITTVAVFVGLTDQIAALEIPFTLAAGDALTSNATNAVGVLYDTAADTDNWWLVGVKADVDATKQNTALAPSNNAFETWRIELTATGEANFYRNGVAIGTQMANATTPSVLLTPVVAAFSRTNASRNVDTDAALLQVQR